MTPPNGKLGEKKPLLEFLITEVQVHESIWNKKSKDYKNIFIKSNSWSEILENLRSTFTDDVCSRFKMNTVEGIKAQWKNLRDSYGKMKKKAKGKSGAGLDDVQDKKDWPFFQNLQFLDQSDEYGNGVKGISSFMDADGKGPFEYYMKPFGYFSDPSSPSPPPMCHLSFFNRLFLRLKALNYEMN